ncbi:hypothetical protein [Pseudogracilibacillus auburnensis]|uniref:hypothetical protein n=1 Tax=Pseudogracilibacillus auburnensis TaxID=1494959 RepID=UPI001A9612C4|nr:hypothetical protein [Pseudogracilibacillus auburnensis]MBO1005109.1 hypothetical protein [Pseudogracilibacillus auburnensis]
MKSRISIWTTNLGCTTMIIGIGIFILATMAINIEAGIILFAFFSFIAIIIFGVSSSIEKANKKKLKKYINRIRPLNVNFQETQSYTSFDSINKIAIDETNQIVCIWQPANEVKRYTKKIKYEVYEYPFSDVLAVEMSENGRSIGTVTRTSQSVRHLLDGLLDEDDGTLIGGHQVGDKASKNISTMELKIIVKDISKPLHLIHFFHFASGLGKLRKYSPKYQEYLQELRHWYILLNLIIKQADHLNTDAKNQSSVHNIPVDLEYDGRSLKEKTEEAAEAFIRTVDHRETTAFHFDEIIETTGSYSLTSQEEEKEVDEGVEQSKEGTETSLSDFEKFLEENKRKQLHPK